MLGRYAPGTRRASGPVSVIADVLRRNMSSDEYRLVTDHNLRDYPWLSAGMHLRIKKDIVVHQDSKPTGKVYQVGAIWTVSKGVVDEPEVVWLRQSDGEPHTWDGSDIFDTFEKVE